MSWRCVHRRIGWPQGPWRGRKTVQCFDCGRRLDYDWERMAIVPRERARRRLWRPVVLVDRLAGRGFTEEFGEETSMLDRIFAIGNWVAAGLVVLGVIYAAFHLAR